MPTLPLCARPPSAQVAGQDPQRAVRVSAPNTCPGLARHKPLVRCSREAAPPKRGRLTSLSLPGGEQDAPRFCLAVSFRGSGMGAGHPHSSFPQRGVWI